MEVLSDPATPYAVMGRYQHHLELIRNEESQTLLQPWQIKI